MAGALADRESVELPSGGRRPLYTPEQRRRRDETGWTTVQGVLAPVQFLAFVVSLVLVVRALVTSDGFAAADVSVLVKTALLYGIMVTGAIWEKRVFGRYLFAEAFFWEDVVSMVVVGLHTAYVAARAGEWLDGRAQLWLALAAYAAYVMNAAQFLIKLRMGRLDESQRVAEEST